jgi:hypothetical protein
VLSFKLGTTHITALGESYKDWFAGKKLSVHLIDSTR